MAEKRYYYKAKSGERYLNLKSPLSKEDLKDYDEITKEVFDAETYVEPHVETAKEKAAREKKQEIAQLKKQLADTDYCVIKIAEGAATAEEYADVISQRATWRARINELEGE